MQRPGAGTALNAAAARCLGNRGEAEEEGQKRGQSKRGGASMERVGRGSGNVQPKNRAVGQEVSMA